MFSTFKILVIYLIIPSRCANTPPPSGGKTTLSFKELVKEEMSPFAKLVSMIPDDADRGELKGKLEMLALRALNGEMENEMLFKNQGRLETQKDKADMCQLLLAFTFKVDTLEKLSAPGEKFKGQQRSKRWTYIFTKNTPVVENLRNKVYAAGMTEVYFAEQVERLIQERNNRAGHANIKEKTIVGALEIMEITEDDKAVETLKILVAPVKGLDLTTTQKS